MLIGFSGTTPPERGDFGATVEHDQLLLPAVLMRPLRQVQVRTAEDLIAFLQAFPASIASDLGWDLDDVRLAQRGLYQLLRGYLADEFFREEPSFRPRYGVR